MKLNTVAQWLFLAVIVFAVWWSFNVMNPPAVTPSDAPESKFSAVRAMAYIRQIAHAPHPVGTEEHERVKQYLVDQLNRMGVTAQLVKATAIRAAGLTAGTIQNIMGLIEGRDTTRTIVLMAHYDSVFYGPGAADDAAGVATILETVRALKTRSQPKHNILIVLTDGEELGLLGANHFMKSYEQIETVDLVINLEARGTSGRSFMFETNSKNNLIIPLFSKANPSVAANSFTYTVYKLLPNSTDFTVIKPYGVQGLNFAFIDDLVNYHTMQDRPENVSLSSLQHQGEQLLNSVLFFANSDKKLTGDYDLAYFNAPFGGLIYYPQYWAPFLTVGAVVLLILFVMTVYRKSATRYFFRTLISLVIITLITGLILLGHYYLAKLVYFLNPQSPWLQQGELYQADWYFWGFLSLNIAIIIGTLEWITRKIGFGSVMTAIYAFILILTSSLVWLLPGVHYLLFWPLFFSLVGMLLVISNQHPDEILSWKNSSILLICFLPILFLSAPYTKLLHTALTTRMITFGMLFSTFIIYLCWPLIRGLTHSREYLLGGFAFLAVAIFIYAHLNSTFSSDQRKQNSLIHHYDFDTKKAFWLSKDRLTDEWTRKFLGASPRDTVLENYIFFGNEHLLKNKPEFQNLNFNPPRFSIIEDSVTEKLRYIRAFVQFNEVANIGRFSLRDNERLQKIAVNGNVVFDKKEPIPNQTKGFDRQLVFTDQRDGYYLEITFDNPARPLHLLSTFYRTSFSPTLLKNMEPREAYMMPKPFGFTDGMSWRKIFLIEGRKM